MLILSVQTIWILNYHKYYPVWLQRKHLWASSRLPRQFYEPGQKAIWRLPLKSLQHMAVSIVVILSHFMWFHVISVENWSQDVYVSSLGRDAWSIIKDGQMVTWSFHIIVICQYCHVLISHIDIVHMTICSYMTSITYYCITWMDTDMPTPPGPSHLSWSGLPGSGA